MEENNTLENSSHLLNKFVTFIETNPSKIILIKVIDQNFYEGRIILKNLTNNYVVYRFFNNYGITYTISPSVYFIKPFENFTVNIKRFEKVHIDQLKSKDKFLLVAMESANTMTEEDIYSPTAQQINLEIELDNGSNSVNYYNMINERKTIVKEYNQQLNINSLSSVEEIKKYIEETKEEIEKINYEIENLMLVLKDTSANQIVKKPNIYFDKEKFEQKIKENNHIGLIQENYPIFLVVFICCIGLFIGKIIYKII